MTGIALEDGVLRVDREPNELDRLAIEFTSILDELSIEHVYVADYLAILAGRARATADIDVLLDEPDETTLEDLVERLDDAGLWGPAMPLASIHDLGARPSGSPGPAKSSPISTSSSCGIGSTGPRWPNVSPRV